MSGIANAVGKALTPAFYVQSWKTFLERSHNYYHPLMKSGSYVDFESADDRQKHSNLFLISQIRFSRRLVTVSSLCGI
jgi:hypothetical protein